MIPLLLICKFLFEKAICWLCNLNAVVMTFVTEMSEVKNEISTLMTSCNVANYVWTNLNSKFNSRNLKCINQFDKRVWFSWKPSNFFIRYFTTLTQFITKYVRVSKLKIKRKTTKEFLEVAMHYPVVNPTKLD